jgi:hypothetical protein
MRILGWLGAWSVLTVGCRLIVPLEGLSGTEPPASNGGASGNGGAGSSGAAGSPAGGGGAQPNRDASSDGKPIDADAPGNVPIEVIRGAEPITGITVNATDIYWVEGGNVFGAPKQGGGPTTGFDSSRIDFDVAVDDTFVYWSDDDHHQVWRKPIASPSVMPDFVFSPGAPRTQYLALGLESQVFVTDPISINSGPRVGNPGFPTGNIYSNQTEVSGIAVFNTDLYWGYGGAKHGVHKGTIDGLTPAVEVIFRDLPGVVSGVATDGDNLYWLEDGRRVRRTPLKVMIGSITEVCSELASVVDADAGFGRNSDLALDDQWVYFSEPSLMRIMKCAK